MIKSERIAKYREIMPIHTRIEIEELERLGFFILPASLRFHGVAAGGLFDHSLAVTECLVELTEKLDLKWGRPESPYIVGMYHDLCKCETYEIEPYTGDFVYRDDAILPGHGDKSVIMLSKYLRLTDEEIACIRWHMGAYETNTEMWRYYDRAIKAFHNVLYTHTADMIASKILGV